MSIDTGFKCDVCGKRRDFGNHWLSMRRYSAPFSDCPSFAAFDTDSPQHVCSAQCAHKALDAWLTKAMEESHYA